VREAASRAAASLKSSYAAGRGAATGGQAPAAAAAGASAAPSAAASGAPPAWATRMKRSQAMSHGATAAAHAVHSGDHGGGSMSVSLHQDDRK
jgi:type IV secretion system protein TrbL